MKKIAIKAFYAITFILFVACLVPAIPFLIYMVLIWNSCGVIEFKKITFRRIIESFRG